MEAAVFLCPLAMKRRRRTNNSERFPVCVLCVGILTYITLLTKPKLGINVEIHHLKNPKCIQYYYSLCLIIPYVQIHFAM